MDRTVTIGITLAIVSILGVLVIQLASSKRAEMAVINACIAKGGVAVRLVGSGYACVKPIQ